MSSTPTPLIAEPPSDSDVIWFGASQRLIGGEPDSSYGWLAHADGPCIVKAISPDLTAYASTLLLHEKKMLQRLATIGAPVPHLVDVGRDDWLVTRFGGLSLQRLQHPQALQGTAPQERLGFGERLAAWVYLLRRLQIMADAGVLVIDLYDANVVLPLTQVTEGQLRLTEVAVIDHAHTVEAGMAMRRPVWINHRMQRIAPELRSVMEADMHALETAFSQAGAALPGYSRMPGERDVLSRRVWAEYNAPQQLQQLLDQGNLNRDHAMQFAAGVSLIGLPALAPSPEAKEKLSAVLQRMTAPDASQRYATLTQAAEALATVVSALPPVSQHHYTPLQPQDLALPATPITPVVPPLATEPAAESFTVVASELAPALQPVTGPSLVPAPQPTHPAMPQLPTAYKLPLRWLYAAVALGAVLGTLWPMR